MAFVSVNRAPLHDHTQFDRQPDSIRIPSYDPDYPLQSLDGLPLDILRGTSHPPSRTRQSIRSQRLQLRK